MAPVRQTPNPVPEEESAEPAERDIDRLAEESAQLLSQSVEAQAHAVAASKRFADALEAHKLIQRQLKRRKPE